MPPAMNINAVVMCGHGGTFKFVPGAPNVMINGAPAVVVGTPGVPQTPCPFVTPAGVPGPCLSLNPMPIAMMSTKVMVGGRPLCYQGTTWMSLGTMPTPTTTAFPGGTTVMCNG